MKVALIGLPNAGRKTLFTLLSGRAIPPGRKPGESVDGIAPIRDPRVDALAAICKPQKKTYAQNHFVLCPTASVDGSGREWLDAARKCDMICLVVAAHGGGLTKRPDGLSQADADRNALVAEVLLADMELAEKRLIRMDKEKRDRQVADSAIEEKALRKFMAAMEAGKPLRDAGVTPQERLATKSLGFLTLLPLLCAYNVAEDDASRSFGPGTLTVSALIEQEIMAMESPEDRKEYLASIGLTASGIERMNAAVYDTLGLMSFYTIGEDECRAWTIRKGTVAPEAGGKVHSDIERGFIRAEVIKFDDLVAAGSEKAAREAGKAHTKGRDYVIEDGDICHFLFNV